MEPFESAYAFGVEHVGAAQHRGAPPGVREGREADHAIVGVPFGGLALDSDPLGLGWNRRLFFLDGIVFPIRRVSVGTARDATAASTVARSGPLDNRRDVRG